MRVLGGGWGSEMIECHKYRVLNNGEMTGVLEFNRLTEVFGGSWYVGVIDGKSSGEGLIVN